MKRLLAAVLMCTSMIATASVKTEGSFKVHSAETNFYGGSESRTSTDSIPWDMRLIYTPQNNKVVMFLAPRMCKDHEAESVVNSQPIRARITYGVIENTDHVGCYLEAVGDASEEFLRLQYFIGRVVIDGVPFNARF